MTGKEGQGVEIKKAAGDPMGHPQRYAVFTKGF